MIPQRPKHGYYTIKMIDCERHFLTNIPKLKTSISAMSGANLPWTQEISFLI
jgi:hypothetical protein